MDGTILPPALLPIATVKLIRSFIFALFRSAQDWPIDTHSALIADRDCPPQRLFQRSNQRLFLHPWRDHHAKVRAVGVRHEGFLVDIELELDCITLAHWHRSMPIVRVHAVHEVTEFNPEQSGRRLTRC